MLAVDYDFSMSFGLQEPCTPVHEPRREVMGPVRRWWIYQSERFPVFGHGLLIAAFSLSAVCFSALLRGNTTSPLFLSILVAFVTSFFSFLQLRIADEFKDFEEDSRYRPYRAVPRGLVTLRELGWLGVLAGAIQLALALWLQPALLWLLLVTWTYLALMSREFFLRDWLKARPFTYLWTHMLIMPLIDLYATACDWKVAEARLPSGIFWFLVVSFFNGVVLEMGRKIRAPGDEEHGVPTYTALWGRRLAVGGWLCSLVFTAACALMAAVEIRFVQPLAVCLDVLLLLATLNAVQFLRGPTSKSAKRFELIAGLWTLCMYLMLGAVPMLLRFLR